MIGWIHPSISQFSLFSDQEYSQELKIQVEHLNKEKEDMLKQIQNKDELLAQTQEELRTFKRKSETIGKETCLKK